ncbi:MAG: hypothetical protein ABEH88_09775 [Halobacteriales archaeon]
MPMTDDGDRGSMDGRIVPTDADEPVEAYETEEGTVLYDAGNPLAWIESSVTVPIKEAS